MTDSSPLSTPKRKRTDFTTEDSPSPVFAAFSFDVNGPALVPISGSSSPRTKVAHRFRGLALTEHGYGPASGPAAQAHGSGLSGGGVASTAISIHAHHDNETAKPDQPLHSCMEIEENESIMRKRLRVSPKPDDPGAPLNSTEDAQTCAELQETSDIRKSQLPTAAEVTIQAPQTAAIAGEASTIPNSVDQLAFDQAILASSPKPSPSKLLTRVLSAPNNRPVDAVKSRVRKRAGTPPLTGNHTIKTSKAGQTATEIIDPIRAALTWHDDEITVYDPEDEDDDGVGINGIGFKPTPAIAYARTVKRRQQLAEYKKREEREARARRNLRRRGSPMRAMPTMASNDTVTRKVRFTETEPSMMIETI